MRLPVRISRIVTPLLLTILLATACGSTVQQTAAPGVGPTQAPGGELTVPTAGEPVPLGPGGGGGTGAGGTTAGGTGTAPAGTGGTGAGGAGGGGSSGGGN